MSLKYYNTVWQNSRQAKTRLLLLLAIADVADEDGVCWPGAPFLAKMIRAKEDPETGEPSIRNIYRMISSIEKEGELFVFKSQGKYNIYIITTDRTVEDIAATMVKHPRIALEPDIAFELASIVVKLQQDTRDKLSLVTKKSETRDKAMSHDPRSDLKIEDPRKAEDYIELQNNVIRVCKRLNPLALQANEVEAIDILHHSGVSGEEVLQYYAPEKWWYQNDWRGKRGQYPTPKQIIETIEQARAFKDSALPDFNAAWDEIMHWLHGRQKASEFTHPWTLDAVRTIGEDNLRYMNEKQVPAIKARMAQYWREKATTDA